MIYFHDYSSRSEIFNCTSEEFEHEIQEGRKLFIDDNGVCSKYVIVEVNYQFNIVNRNACKIGFGSVTVYLKKVDTK